MLTLYLKHFHKKPTHLASLFIERPKLRLLYIKEHNQRFERETKLKIVKQEEINVILSNMHTLSHIQNNTTPNSKSINKFWNLFPITTFPPPWKHTISPNSPATRPLSHLALSTNFMSPSKFLTLMMVDKALHNPLCYPLLPTTPTTPMSSFRPHLLYSSPCSLHSCLTDLTFLSFQIFQCAVTIGPTALAVPRPGTLFPNFGYSKLKISPLLQAFAQSSSC